MGPGRPGNPFPGRPDRPTREFTHRNGTIERQFGDGSRHLIHDRGVKEIRRDGSVRYTDSQGQLRESVRRGVRTTFHEDGSRTIKMGRGQFRERVELRNDRHFLVRNFQGRNSVLGRDYQRNYQYSVGRSPHWNKTLWFYEPGLSLGRLNYGFLSSNYSRHYNPIWSYEYWNNRSWKHYGWWQHYSSFYWKPWGYRHHGYYRPSFAVVDYILARTAEEAWGCRLAERREAVRQQYEDQMMDADPQDVPALEQEQEQAMQQAEQDEIQQAQQEANDQASGAPTDPNGESGQTAVSEDDQSQFASQVEQIAKDRQEQTPVSTAFENALQNDKFLYLVNAKPEGTYDSGDGNTCELQPGNILIKDSLIPETGIVTLKVKVGVPRSCKAGTLVTMTIPQLQGIFNAFQGSMDDGAQELADKNQPTEDSTN